MPKYRIELFWSDDDVCWIANVPALVTCSAHGETPEQALAALRDAVTGWLATASAIGMAIPA